MYRHRSSQQVRQRLLQPKEKEKMEASAVPNPQTAAPLLTQGLRRLLVLRAQPRRRVVLVRTGFIMEVQEEKAQAFPNPQTAAPLLPQGWRCLLRHCRLVQP